MVASKRNFRVKKTCEECSEPNYGTEVFIVYPPKMHGHNHTWEHAMCKASRELRETNLKRLAELNGGTAPLPFT